MKVLMDFNREKGEISVAMALGMPIEETKKLSDEELIKKAFRYASTYGFCKMEFVKERN